MSLLNLIVKSIKPSYAEVSKNGILNRLKGEKKYAARVFYQLDMVIISSDIGYHSHHDTFDEALNNLPLLKREVEKRIELGLV